jgi:L-amino acid N-acyltransferase YncA
MDIQFVEMKEEHLPMVREIYDFYVQNSSATFHTGSVSINDLQEFMFIGHSLYKSYIIMCDGELNGYAYLTQFKKREAYNRTAEITVYLRSGATGKGLGTTALLFLERQATELGIKVLIATISGSNKHSIHVFEKLGYFCCGHFREVGEKFGTILDVFTYEKILTDK